MGFKGRGAKKVAVLEGGFVVMTIYWEEERAVWYAGRVQISDGLCLAKIAVSLQKWLLVFEERKIMKKKSQSMFYSKPPL